MLLERATSCSQNLKSKNYMQSMKRFSMQSWTPILFFWVLGGGGGDFSLCTNVFPLCSQSSPRHSQKHHMCSGKCSSFHLQAGQKGRTPCFKIKPSILGNLHLFLFLSNGPIKLVHCKKKNKPKNKLGKYPSN
jgi:hypothetical protein